MLEFDPVPRRARHDGWTPKRQRAFIAALAETGSVSLAAEAVNMSSEGAYSLRRQPGSAGFRDAWDAALDHGAEIVDGAALDRSIRGVAVPIFHNGKQIGERRVFNERLTMFMLQHRKPDKYGPAKKGDFAAGELERAEKIKQDIVANHDERMKKLARMYLGRVGQERKCRLAGDIIGADFYLRQLTHMEVMLEFGGALKYILWDCEGGTSDGSKSVYGTEVTEELDRMRRQAWAEAGDPDRPRMINNRTELPNYIVGGPDIRERQALLEDATSRAAEAQRMLEEALADQVYAKTGERYDPRAGRTEGEGKEPEPDLD